MTSLRLVFPTADQLIQCQVFLIPPNPNPPRPLPLSHVPPGIHGSCLRLILPSGRQPRNCLQEQSASVTDSVSNSLLSFFIWVQMLETPSRHNTSLKYDKDTEARILGSSKGFRIVPESQGVGANPAWSPGGKWPAQMRIGQYSCC